METGRDKQGEVRHETLENEKLILKTSPSKFDVHLIYI